MDRAGQVRVRAVVRDVVAVVAPAELVLVDGLALFDDATAVRRLSGRGGRREPLGFGLGEMAALVTPVVWLVLDQTVRKFAESAVDGSLRGARGLLRKALRRADEPLVIPPLTAGQLAEVRTRVLESASHRGLPVECAEAVADAVVARLAFTSAGAAPERREDPADGSPSGGS
ncbi:hypothetical protein [Streptomyces iconiensis]|uniref:Uncharacterized protein n=1 Tax=Streptomyces iconiensis TaxID=1384038 RepID=A0ABT7A267_9ACTN|nr:hypothetical protein [Streptomyces iconiensis]MDJ1135415.1 hypothetical protein [Streptomyces iconiensis]